MSDFCYYLIIITNQSGIGRGFFSEGDYLKLEEWINKDLRRKGINISATYYCPHMEDAKIEKYRGVCQCRKPKLEMFWRASIDFQVDLDRSYAIGDRMRDLSICNVSKCRGYLVGKTEPSDIIKDVKNGNRYPIIWKSNIYECAVDIIKKNDL